MNDLQAIADRVQIEALRGEELNYAIYHDRYRRTGDGWKFTERFYEVRYLDHSPLAGSARRPGDRADPSAPAVAAAPDRSSRAAMEEKAI
ncbi:MAG: nuclear transport factor 2 family protein [Nocardiopsaceae bacterium]|jgi:hypothetical protein|nr:nuclear transport factor 2 family protein [Nocardiopsaceae bacterium]